jgi:hypothetical protein
MLLVGHGHCFSSRGVFGSGGSGHCKAWLWVSQVASHMHLDAEGCWVAGCGCSWLLCCIFSAFLEEAGVVPRMYSLWSCCLFDEAAGEGNAAVSDPDKKPNKT